MKKLYMSFLLVTQIITASERNNNSSTSITAQALVSNISLKELLKKRDVNRNKQQSLQHAIIIKNNEIALIDNKIEQFKSSGLLASINDKLVIERKRQFDLNFKRPDDYALERYKNLSPEQQWYQAQWSQIPGVEKNPQAIIQYLTLKASLALQMSQEAFEYGKSQNIQKLTGEQIFLMNHLNQDIDMKKSIKNEIKIFEDCIAVYEDKNVAYEDSIKQNITSKYEDSIKRITIRKWVKRNRARKELKIQQEQLEKKQKESEKQVENQSDDLFLLKEEALKKAKLEAYRLQLIADKKLEDEAKQKLEHERRNAQRAKSQADNEARKAKEIKEAQDKRKQNKQKQNSKKSGINNDAVKIALAKQKAEELAYLDSIVQLNEVKRPVVDVPVAEITNSVEDVFKEEICAQSLAEKNALKLVRTQDEIALAMIHRRKKLKELLMGVDGQDVTSEKIIEDLRCYDTSHNLFQDKHHFAHELVFLVKDFVAELAKDSDLPVSQVNMVLSQNIATKIKTVHDQAALYNTSNEMVPLYKYFESDQEFHADLASQVAKLAAECSNYNYEEIDKELKDNDKKVESVKNLIATIEQRRSNEIIAVIEPKGSKKGVDGMQRIYGIQKNQQQVQEICKKPLEQIGQCNIKLVEYQKNIAELIKKINKLSFNNNLQMIYNNVTFHPKVDDFIDFLPQHDTHSDMTISDMYTMRKEVTDICRVDIMKKLRDKLKDEHADLEDACKNYEPEDQLMSALQEVDNKIDSSNKLARSAFMLEAFVNLVHNNRETTAQQIAVAIMEKEKIDKKLNEEKQDIKDKLDKFQLKAHLASQLSEVSSFLKKN